MNGFKKRRKEDDCDADMLLSGRQGSAVSQIRLLKALIIPWHAHAIENLGRRIHSRPEGAVRSLSLCNSQDLGWLSTFHGNSNERSLRVLICLGESCRDIAGWQTAEVPGISWTDVAR